MELTCRVPDSFFNNVPKGQRVAQATAALTKGCKTPIDDNPNRGRWSESFTPLVLQVTPDIYRVVEDLAKREFEGHTAAAAGWLISHGSGNTPPLPSRAPTVPPSPEGLKQWRERLKLSTQQTAELAGLKSRGTILKAEKGDSGPEARLKIAIALWNYEQPL